MQSEVPIDEGLRQTMVAETAICSVQSWDAQLLYRGYALSDLLDKEVSYEQVLFLLLYERFPEDSELAALQETLMRHRMLPPRLASVLEQIPETAQGIEVLMVALAFLHAGESLAAGAEKGEKGKEEVRTFVLRWLAQTPVILVYWYAYTHQKTAVKPTKRSLAGYFLEAMGITCDALAEKTLNAALILYAEHALNTSTFALRICASARSDIGAAFLAACATLKGPLHGGAIVWAKDYLDSYTSLEEVPERVQQDLQQKKRIPGFGHATYKIIDPRAAYIKQLAQELAQRSGDMFYYDLAECLEAYIWERKKLLPNTDLYHAVAFHYLKIPATFFTAIFAFARMAGWGAHFLEQSNSKYIIRPKARYTGPEPKDF